MKRGLFLVDTPSHVFNVKEALSAYQISEYDLMINDCNRVDTFVQLKTMIDDLIPPAHLIEVPKVEGQLEERVQEYAQHLPFLESRKYTHVFFSSIRQHWQRDVVCTLSPSKLILLDDGNATIPFYEYFFSKRKFFDFPDEPNIERRHIAAEIRSRLRISTEEPSKLELFTYFDLKPLPWLSIKRNLLNSLSKSHQEVDPNLIYFLGIGAVTVNYISQSGYLKLLAHTRALMPGKTFHYIPHRIESIELLDEIAKLGFTVQRLHIPIENWLYNLDIAPYALMSYYSTALFTCAIMFKSIRVVSVKPDMATWLSAADSHVWNLKSCNNYQLLTTIYEYLNDNKSIESVVLQSELYSQV